MSRSYKIWCETEGQGAKNPVKFGSNKKLTIHVNVGSARDSHRFTKIEVIALNDTSFFLDIDGVTVLGYDTASRARWDIEKAVISLLNKS